MKSTVGAILLVAMTVLGCGLLPQRSGDVLPLLTGLDPELAGKTGQIACYTNSAAGPVVIDPRYGTAIIDKDLNHDNTIPMPIMWRPGFTGRRVGSEIAVYDPQGSLVAITGRSYRIEGAGYRVEGADILARGACGDVIPWP